MFSNFFGREEMSDWKIYDIIELEQKSILRRKKDGIRIVTTERMYGTCKRGR